MNVVRAAGTALLLCGCSQIFGLEPPTTATAIPDADIEIDAAPPDAPAACGPHDFDADGIPDGCDMCPHIASADVDGDGDGVGDPCDPRPTTSGDHRALWLAFYDANDVANWSNYNNGTWLISGNLLHQTNPNLFSLLDSPTNYTDVYFATSLEILQAATYEVGFCAGDKQASQQYYCCGATNMTTPTVRAIGEYSGSAGQLAATAAFSGDLSAGQRLDVIGTVNASTFKCEFRQAASSVSTQLPSGARTGPVAFYATRQVDFRYVFVVTIGP
jgi:hypothetical protein